MASSQTKFETLRVERRGYVSVLTLDRPDRLNALNEQLTHEVGEALKWEADQFPQVRVIILTGAGRGFCSGADVNRIARSLDLRQASAEKGEHEEDGGPSPVMRLAPFIRQLPQPIIAAVNGHADVVRWLLRNGANLSLRDIWNSTALDIALASEHASIANILRRHGVTD